MKSYTSLLVLKALMDQVNLITRRDAIAEGIAMNSRVTILSVPNFCRYSRDTIASKGCV